MNEFGSTLRMLAGLLAVAMPVTSLAQISNPGFETGDTSGWTVQTNGAAFPIEVESGQITTSAGTINPSLSDNFYAYTSQSGPGSSFLAQDFTVQSGTNRIFFDIAINNSTSDYFVPDPVSFDFTGPANQQARFDILTPGAPLTTVDPSEIIVTGFQTEPGNPLVQDWTRYDIDVTNELQPYVGQTVTLRFVQVDNQGFFNLAIDNLSVGGQPPPDVPDDEVQAIPMLQAPILLLMIFVIGIVGIRQIMKA